MNILVITDDFYPKTGGVAKYDQSIAEALVANGHRVWMLAPKCDVKDGFTFSVIRYPRLKVFSSLMPFLYSLVIIIFKNIDTVILGYFMSTQGLGGLVGKKLGLVKLITVVCGYDLTYSRRTKIDRVVANAIMNNADKVFTDSDYTGEKVKDEFNNKDNIITLYPVVSREYINVGNKARSKGKKTILTVSRLVTGKGLMILLDAFAIVKKQVPESELVIVGDGPLRKTIIDKVNKLGIERDVRVMGNLDPQALVKTYCECDVFVMVPELDPGGRFEGFGIVYLEANACGIPVIGTFHGGIPEAVINGKTGILIPPGDVKELANALMHVLNDPACKKALGINGQKRVLESFTPNKMKDNLTTICEI